MFQSKGFLLFLILYVFCLASNFSQDAGSNDDAAAKDTAPKVDDAVNDNLEDAKKALQFGIDSTVIGVISQAKEKKDQRLLDEIAKLTDSTNDAVVIEVMNYFAAINKQDTVVPAISQKLINYQDYSDNFTLKALRFIIGAKIKPSDDLSKALKDMATLTTKDRQAVSLEAIGELEVPDAVAFLREAYKKAGSELNARKAALNALGTKKDPSQLSFFKGLYEDAGEDKEVKRTALVAIGKLADAPSLPVIKKAVTSTDLFEREAAINALAGYEPTQVLDAYKQALRDGAWRNRAKAVDAIKTRNIVGLTENLLYLSEKDPERPVRQAALGCLVSFGTAWSQFNAWLSDKKVSNDLKILVSEACVPKHSSFIVPGIISVMDAEWKANKSSLLVAICRNLSFSEVGTSDLFLRMLDHPEEAIKLNGVRGIVTNKMALLKGTLEELSKKQGATPFKSALDDAIKRL